MHPRARLLSFVQIISSRGDRLPLPMIDEAQRLGICLETLITTRKKSEKTKPINHSKIKESPHGS